ncbi:MAG TPA: hypothetical protein VE467_18405 [Chryseolinea sp.]|jgi:hypothetical protein|nr:hypothetical protein [Chryseolinea sp.]HZI23875.1 hypothetical protein [Chryseolinea sp.]
MTTTNVKSVQARWQAQKAKLKLSFPKLTDDDLNFDETHKVEMLKHLEPKLAMTAAELIVIMETL